MPSNAGDASQNLKPHLTAHQQLDLLKARGLQISNDAEALRSLERFGYYRLSGYFYPLRKTKPVGQPGRRSEFINGASFDLVVELAQFDKKLRLLVLDGIETVETAVRVAIAHKLGQVHPLAHLEPRFLDGKFTQQNPRMPSTESAHQKWCSRYEKALKESKEEFVAHHLDNYNGKMPIWAAIEVWDFGMLSRFFSGMQARDRNAVSAKFGLQDGHVLASWLRTFNFIRNLSAHHSRLWNRAMAEVPALPALERCRALNVLHKNERAKERLFGALTCLWYLVSTIEPNSTWKHQVKEHLATFPRSELVSLSSAGFVPDWESSSLWIDA